MGSRSDQSLQRSSHSWRPTGSEASRTRSRSAMSRCDLVAAFLVQVRHRGSGCDHDVAPAEHGPDRGEHDPEVEGRRELLHVAHVQGKPIVPGRQVATIHHRESRDPRPDLESNALGFPEVGKVPDQQGARPDQAHGARHHVEQLGQLVERGPAEPCPQARDAMLVGLWRASDSPERPAWSGTSPCGTGPRAGPGASGGRTPVGRRRAAPPGRRRPARERGGPAGPSPKRGPRVA